MLHLISSTPHIWFTSQSVATRRSYSLTLGFIFRSTLWESSHGEVVRIRFRGPLGIPISNSMYIIYPGAERRIQPNGARLLTQATRLSCPIPQFKYINRIQYSPSVIQKLTLGRILFSTLSPSTWGYTLIICVSWRRRMPSSSMKKRVCPSHHTRADIEGKAELLIAWKINYSQQT